VAPFNRYPFSGKKTPPVRTSPIRPHPPGRFHDGVCRSGAVNGEAERGPSCPQRCPTARPPANLRASSGEPALLRKGRSALRGQCPDAPAQYALPWRHWQTTLNHGKMLLSEKPGALAHQCPSKRPLMTELEKDEQFYRDTESNCLSETRRPPTWDARTARHPTPACGAARPCSKPASATLE